MDDRTEAAEKRTEFAEDRTILANERTFASWMRTSLGCLGVGIGAHALFQRIEPAWVPRGVATIFLIIAVAVVVLAERRSGAVVARLTSHAVETAKPVNLRLLAAGITVGSAALIATIWLTDI